MRLLSYDQLYYVPDIIAITLFYATFSNKKFSSFGRPVLDHLAADGAGLAGSQVTVVTVGQVNTNFLCCLHLELVHSLASLGNVQLVVIGIALCNSLLFHFLRKFKTLSVESVFYFRRGIFTRKENNNPVS